MPPPLEAAWGGNKTDENVLYIEKSMHQFQFSSALARAGPATKKTTKGVTTGDDEWRGRAKIVVKCLFIFYVHSLLPLLFVITSASQKGGNVALKASALKMTIGHQNGN